MAANGQSDAPSEAAETTDANGNVPYSCCIDLIPFFYQPLIDQEK